MEQRKRVEERAIEYIDQESRAHRDYYGAALTKHMREYMRRAYRHGWHDCLAEVEERLHKLCNVRQVQELIEEMKRPI